MRGYRLYTDSTEQERIRGAIRYSREELEEMTTFQLRNICYKERLVEGLTRRLDREEMIRVILKYLSADEQLWITTASEGGLERLQRALRQYARVPLKGDGAIRVPARLVLYEGMAVDKSDGYRVSAGTELNESNVLLVNDQMEICGIFNLHKDNEQRGFYLTAEAGNEWAATANRQYSLLFFRRRDSEYLYKTYYQEQGLPPAQLHYYKIPLADLEIRRLEETDAVLAIDFGTSNTTAGACLPGGAGQAGQARHLKQADGLSGRFLAGEVQFVKFLDSTYKQLEWTEALPTAVSVADCSNPEAIQYEFGYEALKNMRRSGYSGRANVFLGLKRWVNGYNKAIEITDAEGNAVGVRRRDILEAYLRYIISMAEHQFKCKFKYLHFTSPIKMKAPFLNMFTELLPDYIIEREHALDEGMAVLYNTIADGIEQGSFREGQEYQALVIDCGGGTTDLSSCKFEFADGHMSFRLDMETTYENGDTHFGGDNITYRIMQFMKIVFADYYTSGRRTITDIDSLIPIPGNDLFREVDQHGIGEVYAELMRKYAEAEAIIPTAYAQYENRSRDEYLRVRGNFYFLWEIAENMKEQFFRKTGILRNRFYSEHQEEREQDLQITTMERWFLSVRRGAELKDEYEFPDVVFNIKEISQLIKADIYNVVRKFLEDFYQEGRLGHYSIIKLTGQSCRIDVFREALKEFVPGRSIEFRQKPAEGRVPELKLSCLRGAIRYWNARKSGTVEAVIRNQAAMIPYAVSAYTHSGRQVELIRYLDPSNGSPGAVSRPSDVAEVELYLFGSDGQLRHKYSYYNQTNNYKPVLYEDIAKHLDGRIPQDDTDSIVNGETKFFVYADLQQWGFHVLPVARQADQLYLGKGVIFPFEQDVSELDFFDGFK
ncbi:molecular chaperone [Paenibacillus sp. CAA11]|uniref:molecular chaperone n=1 Tax=Paenibacillus sp. CAA11 TaxID=1532905 RepID=UPI000D33C292|nr:molecular chaperone [Paenibacillus sp. CAA11]AWB43679.1 molecular chaperone [Paenibacillus sp. CAA11]